MISVIICDDEILARVGLQSLLEPCTDIHIAGVFGSAKESLAYLREHSVDIVITDVEMAGMNGLRFVEMLRTDYLTKGVIIVSAHENFEYVRKAMHMGAHRYILKQELNGEVLIDAVHQIYNKLPQKKHTVKVDRENDREKEQRKRYVLGVLSFRNSLEAEEAGTDLQDMQYDENIIYSLLEDMVQNMQMGSMYRALNRNAFVSFEFPENTEDEVCRKKSETYAAAINRMVNQYVEIRTVLGLSGVFSNRKDLMEMYGQSRDAGELSFYHRDRTWFWQEELSEQIPELMISAEVFLEEDGIEKTVETIQWHLEQCAKQNLAVFRYRKHLTIKLDAFLHQLFGKIGYGDRQDFKSTYRTQIMSAVAESADAQRLLVELHRILEEMAVNIGQATSADKLEVTLRYIDAHLTEKMVLQDVAKESCMSISTFCNFFKEQTGCTFVQYVNNLRIKRVKELLLNRELSIEQIAEMTGFSNENYLIRVFKKTVGITVSEYRRACKKMNKKKIVNEEKS